MKVFTVVFLVMCSAFLLLPIPVSAGTHGGGGGGGHQQARGGGSGRGNAGNRKGATGGRASKQVAGGKGHQAIVATRGYYGGGHHHHGGFFWGNGWGGGWYGYYYPVAPVWYWNANVQMGWRIGIAPFATNAGIKFDLDEIPAGKDRKAVENARVYVASADGEGTLGLVGRVKSFAGGLHPTLKLQPGSHELKVVLNDGREISIPNVVVQYGHTTHVALTLQDNTAVASDGKEEPDKKESEESKQ